MKHIAILGSTGSIGTQTLDVVRQNGDIIVEALAAAGSNIALLLEQIKEFQPKLVCVFSEEKALELKEILLKEENKTEVVTGMEGLIACATTKDVEMVVTAFVGMIGIRPTMEAIKAGKHIAHQRNQTSDGDDGKVAGPETRLLWGMHGIFAPLSEFGQQKSHPDRVAKTAEESNRSGKPLAPRAS